MLHEDEMPGSAPMSTSAHPLTHPLLQKEVPYYIRKSLTIEGSPLL